MPEATLAAPAAESVSANAPATTEPTSPAESGAVSSPVAAPATEAVPEYKLTLPENAALDATAVERTVALAKELGITPEHAQRILAHADSETAARLAAQQEAHAKTVKEWRESALNDNALGKTPETRKAAIDRGISVIDRYGESHKGDAEALRGFFNETGIGNHPAAIRFLAWIGKSMGEPQGVPKGQPATDEVDQRKLWFPKTYGSDAA